MCVVSMIGDDYGKNFPGRWPSLLDVNYVSKAEFEIWKAEHRQMYDELKAELESIKKLLKAAKIYDEETDQPDCEVDEKVALFKKLGELLGVAMSEVFGDDK